MTSGLPEPLCGGTAWASHTDIPGFDDTTPGKPYTLHDPDTWCVYLTMATDILWAATGRRWRGAGRTATATLRARPHGDEPGYHRSWSACPCSRYLTASDIATPRRIAHYEPTKVRLPHDDVTAVTSVTIDGAPFAGWYLDGAWIVRDDRRGWPMCGDRTVITYTYGRNPPAAGKAMCVELAVELGREGAGAGSDQECRLPRRASTVTRQNLTYTTENYLDYLDNGLTGLLGPDMWIKSVNPKGRAQAASVWSPDHTYARRTS